MLLDSFFRYSSEMPSIFTMFCEVLSDKSKVVKMVFLLFPSLHRVNALTFSSVLTFFFFSFTKTVGLLQKVMF